MISWVGIGGWGVSDGSAISAAIIGATVGEAVGVTIPGKSPTITAITTTAINPIATYARALIEYCSLFQSTPPKGGDIDGAGAAPEADPGGSAGGRREHYMASFRASSWAAAA